MRCAVLKEQESPERAGYTRTPSPVSCIDQLEDEKGSLMGQKREVEQEKASIRDELVRLEQEKLDLDSARHGLDQSLQDVEQSQEVLEERLRALQGQRAELQEQLAQVLSRQGVGCNISLYFFQYGKHMEIVL